MDRISNLPNELLVKILSFVPTKVAVSTSVLSKRWERLWMGVPKLDCGHIDEPEIRDFICKNLPLRAPFIEILCLENFQPFQFEDIKRWVEIAVSHCLRELSIYFCNYVVPELILPRSLYTCKSLVILKTEGSGILVDVPPTACLPSLKTLQLEEVTYSNEDSLRLLLSHCPVLEDLLIRREDEADKAVIVVIVPSLLRLTLRNDCCCGHYPSVDGYIIDLSVMQNIVKLLEQCTHVKRLSLRELCSGEDEHKYRSGIVFNRLEYLKLCICNDNWSKLLVWLLRNSPKLRVLNLYVESYPPYEEYVRIRWKNKRSFVPECLRTSLETLKFVGYIGRPEERDFLSFIFKHARCLKSISIGDYVRR
ncbi:unnamed protein product [Thlaspi arvense]|uniref:F-box domain-containing protein n=1 Tax=Thlaspi arvense TaxID=13288 RepID=A0AAU9SST6_THLAR|nr:unnamed protein product [Thlaspi arvense]